MALAPLLTPHPFTPDGSDCRARDWARGWLESSIQVSQYLHTEHLNRVLLLSDGLANVGETRSDTIANDVHGLSMRGVSTTTLGIGNDYSEDLLEAMARSDFPPVAAVEEQVALLMAARARQEAIWNSDRGDIPQAVASLQAMRSTLSAAPASPMMMEEIDALMDLEADFSAGEVAKARKKSTSQRYNRQRSRPNPPQS